jgi:hypothetical protein
VALISALTAAVPLSKEAIANPPNPLRNPLRKPLTNPLRNPLPDPLANPLPNPLADPLPNPLGNPLPCVLERIGVHIGAGVWCKIQNAHYYRNLVLKMVGFLS